MNATVDGTLCEPLAGQTEGGGGGPHLQTGWYTCSFRLPPRLIHSPPPITATTVEAGPLTAMITLP
jgi:hypothetical protein